MKPDNWKPLRSTDRTMNINQAYYIIENQRDLLSVYMATNKLLTFWEKDKIYAEIRNMNNWLHEHKHKIHESQST